MKRPLSDIRVLDLTQNMCGPYCTQILGDLGAEIIKIEPPGGEISRQVGTRHGATSITYIHFNRGKKSVELDLAKPSHREVLLKLAEKSDLVVEDFMPGTSEKLGIGYGDIKKIKSDILYIAITGYGQQGMYKNYSDLDPIVQAISGFMSITGEKGGEFTKAGAPLADLFTGIYGVIGALAAIIHRRKTGESLYVDISKLNVMLSAMPDSMSKYLNTGCITRPKGNKHQLVAISQALRTKDGLVLCKASEDKEFKTFTDALGLQGLGDDERFNDTRKRCDNINELEPIIHSKTSKMTMAELNDLMLRLNCAAGPVNTIEQILEDEYTKFHQLITNVHDSKEGDFKVVGSPLKFEKFAIPRSTFVSQPGEYTAEILTDLLGMDEEEIISLRTLTDRGRIR